LRRDEEAFYEAKREAARVAAKLRVDEQTKRDDAATADTNWASADEWEMYADSSCFHFSFHLSCR